MLDEIALVVIELVVPVGNVLLQVDLLCRPETRLLLFIPLPYIVVLNGEEYEAILILFQYGLLLLHLSVLQGRKGLLLAFKKGLNRLFFSFLVMI